MELSEKEIYSSTNQEVALGLSFKLEILGYRTRLFGSIKASDLKKMATSS